MILYNFINSHEGPFGIFGFNQFIRPNVRLYL